MSTVKENRYASGHRLLPWEILAWGWINKPSLHTRHLGGAQKLQATRDPERECDRVNALASQSLVVIEETWIHLGPRSKSVTPARNSVGVGGGVEGIDCYSLLAKQCVLFLQRPPQRKLGRPAAILWGLSIQLPSAGFTFSNTLLGNQIELLSYQMTNILFPWHHHKNEQKPDY